MSARRQFCLVNDLQQVCIVAEFGGRLQRLGTHCKGVCRCDVLQTWTLCNEPTTELCNNAYLHG